MTLPSRAFALLLLACLLQACTSTQTRTEPPRTTSTSPEEPPPRPTAPPPVACPQCGVVLRIETLRSSASPSSASTPSSPPPAGTLGGLVGGVASGGNRPAATTVRYRIHLQLDSGAVAAVEQSWLPSGLKSGDRVIVRNGQVSLR